MAQVNSPAPPAPPHAVDPVSTHTTITQQTQPFLKDEPRKPLVAEVTLALTQKPTTEPHPDRPSSTNSNLPADHPPPQSDPGSTAGSTKDESDHQLPPAKDDHEEAATRTPGPGNSPKDLQDQSMEDIEANKPQGADKSAQNPSPELSKGGTDSNHSPAHGLPDETRPTKESKSMPSENEATLDQHDSTKAAPVRRAARRTRKPAPKREASQGLSPAPTQARKPSKSARVATQKHEESATVVEAKSVLGSLDDYREKGLELERVRHERLFQAEKRKLYAEQIVRWTYDHEIRLTEEEYDSARRVLTVRLLQENAEKQRRVEELRYKIVRDDVNGTWHKRHEMSLRGRQATGANDDSGAGEREDAGDASNDAHPRAGRPGRRRPTAPSGDVAGRAVRVELDTNEVLADLEEMNGDRRTGSKYGRRGGGR